MPLKQCEFCKRSYSTENISDSGRHPCCGIRSAGEMTGRAEGTCRIIGELGRGATGVVYLAQQLRLQRNVALKLMTNSTLDDEGSARLFFSEVRAAGKLSHPNIVRIYTAGETDKQFPYAIMEYVEGRTLEDDLVRKQRFSHEEVTGIALVIADALHYAWRTAGLTHGDLKPANIMRRNEDDSVCILDLGLQAARQENNIHTAIGTPLYAAPELIKSNFGPTDFHADVYSLGIMMHEMLTGAAPFDGTPAEIMRKHQTEDVQPVHQIIPDVPQALSLLISRMLQRYAQDRPSWIDVIGELQEISKDKEKKQSLTCIPVARPAKKMPDTARLLALFALGILLSGLTGYTLATKTTPVKVPQIRERHVNKETKLQAFRYAEQGRTADLDKMLQDGFPVNTENEQGDSLLMHAVLFRNPETVKMILRYSPDLRHRNKRGENVFDTARALPEMYRLLRIFDK